MLLKLFLLISYISDPIFIFCLSLLSLDVQFTNETQSLGKTTLWLIVQAHEELCHSIAFD